MLGSGDRIGFRRASVSGDRLTVRLASACTSGCALQLRLDAPDGPVAGTLPVRPTGGTDTWQEQSVTLPHRLTGTHDLHLVAKGGDQVAALDWLTVRR